MKIKVNEKIASVGEMVGEVTQGDGGMMVSEQQLVERKIISLICAGCPHV